MFKIFLAFIFYIASTGAVGYHDCGSTLGKLIDFTVDICDLKADNICTIHIPCTLNFNITFLTDAPIVSVRPVVRTEFLGMNFTFVPPNPDGCVDSGLTCPLAANKTFVYRSSLPMKTFYTLARENVTWTLVDENSQNIVCVNLLVDKLHD